MVKTNFKQILVRKYWPQELLAQKKTWAKNFAPKMIWTKNVVQRKSLQKQLWITKYIQKILIKNVGPTNTLVKINIDPKKRITPHPKGFVINFGKEN